MVLDVFRGSKRILAEHLDDIITRWEAELAEVDDEAASERLEILRGWLEQLDGLDDFNIDEVTSD